MCCQSCAVIGCGFYEQGRCLRWKFFNERRNAFPVFYGTERFSIQEFYANNGQLPEGLYSPASFFCPGKVNHGAGTAGLYRFCIYSDFRQEGQRAFRTGHQMHHDIKRIFKFNQRKQVKSRYVLDAVFVPDTLRQFRTAYDLFPYVKQVYKKFRVGAAKSISGRLICCIKYRSVSQDHPGSMQNAVAVGMGSAIHSGCVVGYNTAYHGRRYRCRVGREFSAVGLKDFIHPVSYNPRLQGYGIPVFMDLVLFPIVCRYQQHTVGKTLA